MAITPLVVMSSSGSSYVISPPPTTGGAPQFRVDVADTCRVPPKARLIEAPAGLVQPLRAWPISVSLLPASSGDGVSVLRYQNTGVPLSASCHRMLPSNL